jgi:MFS family permease
MLQRFIHRFFRPRHYWRSVSFDEIAELYTSRLIMVFAVNIVNLFAAVYLYKLGYSIQFIAWFYAAWYAFKVPFAVIAAKYAAYFGPKHGILLANILRIPSLIAFALVAVLPSQQAIVAIVLFGFFQQMAATLYDLCYTIDFSKVKHSEHAGKEIGTMQIMEKTAKIISPVVGGIIASLYSPQATIIVACVLFILAAFPLFRSVEPTRTRTTFRLSGFPWRLALPTLIAETVVGFDFVASGTVWLLFTTTVIFSGMGEGIYATLGSLASLGVLISLVASWTFGQIVDRHKGGILLTVGTIANSMIHLFRPFTASPSAVMGVNIANETATSAYAMPFTRAVFDVADDSGFRITYLMYIEMMLNFGAALGSTLFALFVSGLGDRHGMECMFVVAAVYELIMLFVWRSAR